MIVGVVVHARGAVEGQAVRCGAVGGLDVEVVEHLEVVGDEPAGAHDHARRRRRPSRELVDHREDVGADPRLGGAAGRLPGDLPVVALGRGRPRAATASAVERSSSGYGSPAAMIRCGSEWAVNSTRTRPPFARASRPTRAARSSARNVDERRLDRPTLDADHRDAAPTRRRLAGPIEVLADRVRRVVRCEHQPDDRCRTRRRRVGPRRLDLRIGVLEAERHVESAGRGSIERRLQAVALGLGELRRAGRRPRSPRSGRSRSASGLGRRRTPAADVGVVRLDLVGMCAACRRPSAPRRRAASWSAVHGAHRRALVDEVDDGLQHAGSVSGWTPWPRLKMWPGCWCRRRVRCRAAPARCRRAPARCRRARAPGRGCPARRGRRRGGAGRRGSGCASRGPITVGPACVHRFEQVVAADAEVDRRARRGGGGELAEHLARVGQHVAVVVGGG